MSAVEEAAQRYAATVTAHAEAIAAFTAGTKVYDALHERLRRAGKEMRTAEEALVAAATAPEPEPVVVEPEPELVTVGADAGNIDDDADAWWVI